MQPIFLNNLGCPLFLGWIAKYIFSKKKNPNSFFLNIKKKNIMLYLIHIFWPEFFLILTNTKDFCEKWP
jgi:ACR3 family arsenite efflux pump ArsB